MRQILLATCALFAMTSLAVADDFPGPKVKDSAPFNSKNVMLGSNIACQKTYTAQQFAVDRVKIVADVTQCVRSNFGIAKDLGMDFGAGAYADCVVPNDYDFKPPVNNPRWPVCCAEARANGGYRMSCRLFFTAR